jgi:hypothetical protein
LAGVLQSWPGLAPQDGHCNVIGLVGRNLGIDFAFIVPGIAHTRCH